MSRFQHKAKFICNIVIYLKAILQFVFILQLRQVLT